MSKYRLEFNEKQQAIHHERPNSMRAANTNGWRTISEESENWKLQLFNELLIMRFGYYTDNPIKVTYNQILDEWLILNRIIDISQQNK